MRATLGILAILISFSAAAQKRQWQPKKAKHTKEGCVRAKCSKSHKMKFVELDTITGKAIVVTRMFSGYKGDGPARYKTIEHTYDYKDDLLKSIVRKRSPKKGVTFREITWDADDQLRKKQIGKVRKKKTKEYQDGRLMRYTVMSNRELKVKKNLTKN